MLINLYINHDNANPSVDLVIVLKVLCRSSAYTSKLTTARSIDYKGSEIHLAKL